jgi:hypothetical protein
MQESKEEDHSEYTPSAHASRGGLSSSFYVCIPPDLAKGVASVSVQLLHKGKASLSSDMLDRSADEPSVWFGDLSHQGAYASDVCVSVRTLCVFRDWSR